MNKKADFKVGDRVKVKAGLEPGKKYGIESFMPEMEKYRGEEAVIINNEDGFFSINIDCEWADSAEMLEPIESQNFCPESKTEIALQVKYIFSGPATICIVTEHGQEFKGIAKCAPDDEWDKDTGKAIAFLRAEIARDIWELKQLCK